MFINIQAIRPLVGLLAFVFFLSGATAGTVVDFTAAGSYSLTKSSAQVTTTLQPGLGTDLAISPGTEAYPALTILPSGSSSWNLAGTSYVELSAQNIGTATIYLVVRVDNSSKSDEQAISLNAGASGTVRIYYGYSGGIEGPTVDPSNIIRFYCYVAKDTVNTRKIRLLRISAGGTYGETTPYTRVRPAQGWMFGAGTTFNATSQLVASGGNATLLSSGNVQLNFSAAGQSVKFKPVIGMWDLGLWTQVRTTLKNTGTSSANPKVRVDSVSGSADYAFPAHALAPGETLDIVARFAPNTPWQGVIDNTYQTSLNAAKTWGGQTGTGTTFGSHKTNDVVIVSDSKSTFEVVSSRAENMSSDPPSWLGQQPPPSATGTWVKTFEENFNGPTLDTSRWNTVTTNYWDATVHFSDNDVILGNSFLTLRLEKKTGSDSLNTTPTSYAAGWLDTYNKWKQRYGYWEIRVKLPDVPAMWPAFWLMPLRPNGGNPLSNSTTNGGMEFDIFEGQSIWGPYRTNYAMHWDGYGTNHQQIGYGDVYHQPDRYGFITVGLLWTPGSAILYSNGVEVARWEGARIGNQPSYMMIELVTGGWEHVPLDDAKLPADLVVDYVRVWQRQDLASAVDSSPSIPAGAALTPQQAWRRTYFNTINGTGTAADDQDPDKDGMSNLMEYALGTTPNTVSQVGSVQSVTTVLDGAQSYLTLNISPFGGFKEGITYTPEISSDLVNWSSADLTILDKTPADLLIRDSHPIGYSPKRFLRLRVSSP